MADNKFYYSPLDPDEYKKQLEAEMLSEEPKEEPRDTLDFFTKQLAKARGATVFNTPNSNEIQSQLEFNKDALESGVEADKQARVNEGIRIMDQFTPKDSSHPMTPMSQDQAQGIKEPVAKPRMFSKLMPKVEPKAEVIAPVESKEEAPQTPDELAQAMEARNKELKDVNMFRAFNQLSSGLRGGGYQEHPWMKPAEDLAKQKVADISTKRDEARKLMKDEADKIDLDRTKEFQDANSPISKAYRDSLAKVDPSVKDQEFFKNASAYQIKSVYPMIEADLNSKARAEEKKLVVSARQEDKEIKREDQLSKLTEDRVSGTKSIRGNFGNWRNSEVLADRIDAMLPPPGSKNINRLALKESVGALSQMIKGGVATEGQLKALLPENIQTVFADKEAWVTGKTLPKYDAKEFVDEVRNFAHKIKTVYSDAQKKEMIKHFNSGDARELSKLNPSRFQYTLEVNGFKLGKQNKDGSYEAVPDEESPVKEEKPVVNKTIVDKMYSKSANKTKLVYSDGSEEIVDGRQ